MRESAVRSKVRQYLNGLVKSSWHSVHTGGFTRPGTPDILGCYLGFFVAVETKAPGRQLTKSQQFVKREIEEANGVYIVASSVEEVVEGLRKLLERVKDGSYQPLEIQTTS